MKKYLLFTVLTVFIIEAHGQTTKTVGTSGADYATLKLAFDAINAGTITGDITLQVIDNTTETASAVLNASGGSASYASVLIYPTATGKSITGAVAASLVQLNGADHVTINGSLDQGNTACDLTIENTHTTNATIELTSDASLNLIKYCIIKGASTSTSKGIVFLNTGSATGNDNNTIDHCDIDAGGSALRGIYATGGSATVNNDVTISNNNIFDYKGINSAAIYMLQYNQDWTIEGNSIYQTAAQAGISGTTYGIYIGPTGASSNTVIRNNYIGGNSAACSGTWTVSSAAAYRFVGMYLNFSATAGSKVYNNTIKGFSWLTSSGASTVPGVWAGIYILGGSADIGTDGGNTIGAATGTGSVTVSITTGGGTASVYGIVTAASNISTLKIENNTIGSVTTALSGVSNSGVSIYPIYQANGACVINNNTVGSTTTPNSINASSSNSSASQVQNVYGIYTLSNENVSITNNTIAHLNNAYLLSSSTIGLNRGIYITSSSGTVNVTGNTIFNISSDQAMTGTGEASNIIGICMSANSSTGATLSGNTVYNLESKAATGDVEMIGIFYKGKTSGTNLLAKNLVHSLLLSTSVTTSAIYGIYAANGLTTYQNNMVRLGLDVSGNNLATGYAISGISDQGGTNSYYFNSVYIGGSQASGSDTYAFNSWVAGTTAFQNNIFVNARSNNAGTAKHYGYKITGSGNSSNYNLIYAGGTGGYLGVYNSVDYSTIQSWREATGKDINSAFGDPNFTHATADISATPASPPLKVSGTSPAEGSGLSITGITDDFEGDTRSSLSPTDIGADAGNYTAADIFTPVVSYTVLGNTTSLANRTISGVSITDIGTAVPTSGGNVPRIWYKKNAGGSWVSNAGTLSSGDGNSGLWDFEIDYSVSGFGGTPTGTEVIYYYIVAQDQASTPNIWYSPYTGASHTDVNTQTAAPSLPNSYIISRFSGTISVGSGQTYTTLTGASASNSMFAAINEGVITGDVTIVITSDITEPGTTALNQTTEEGGTNFFITITSDGSARTLSGTTTANTIPLIDFNGADRVTIEGGESRLLTFRITNGTPANTAPALRFQNSSYPCYVNNCIIESNASSTSLGVITVGSGTNYVRVEGNDIRDARAGTSGYPNIGVYSNTSTNYVFIVKNNIYNFKAGSGTSYGVYLNQVSNCRVSGNSFFMESDAAPVNNQTAILVQNGSSHTIENNYIGGQADSCGGGPWTNSGDNISFIGISIPTVGTISTTNVTNNVIQNINISGTGATGCCAISVGVGKVAVGTAGNGNIIGHATNPAKGITIAGSSTYTMIVSGSSYTAGISYNTIANITASGTGTGVGLKAIAYSTAQPSITQNTIQALSTASTNSGFNSGSALIGIVSTSFAGYQNISGNSISDFNASSTTTNSVRIVGILLDNSSSGGSISSNSIIDFENACTNTGGGYISGILINNAFNPTIDNNEISIGNGLNTNAVNIQGIWDNAIGDYAKNYYFNSVYIGGSASSGSLNTYAFYRSNNALIDLKNNIFSNQRTGGSGKHNALAIDANTNITADYNDFFTSTAADLGSVDGGATALDFDTWKSTTGQDGNSFSVDPNFTSTTNLRPTTGNYLAGTGISGITTDIEGIERNDPPSIGAYEYPGVSWLGTSSTDWADEDNWEGGVVPSSTDNVVISAAGNQPHITNGPSTPAECNKLTILEGAILTIDAGKALTVCGATTLNGTDCLILKSDASGQATFIDNGEIYGSGTALVEQYLSGSGSPNAPNGRFFYVGAPVFEAYSEVYDAEAVSNKLWYWSEPDQAYTEVTDNETYLEAQHGYVARMGANTTCQYSGIPNTGYLSITGLTRAETGTTRGFNLISNCYPSGLKWDEVYKYNILPTLWYRTATSGGTMVFDTYNSDSQIGTNNNGFGEVTQFIRPMQAFWVKVYQEIEPEEYAGIEVENGMRSHDMTVAQKSVPDNRDILRLYVSSTTNRDETVLLFSPLASDGYDSWDSEKMFAKLNGLPEIYTMLPGQDAIVINSMSELTEARDIVLGFKCTQAGDYAIYIDAGFFNDATSLILEDTQLNTFTNLRTGNYNFSSPGTNTTSRFILHLVPTCITGTVNYDNLPKTPLSNISLEITPEMSVTPLSIVTSDSTGSFRLPPLPQGTYTLKASCNNPAGGINAIDGMKVLQHFAGLLPLNGLKLAAADVNGSGNVNAIDALLIQKRFVALINTFPAGNWIFEEKTITISGEGNNQTISVKGICTGDTNGSYIP